MAMLRKGHFVGGGSNGGPNPKTMSTIELVGRLEFRLGSGNLNRQDMGTY